MPHGFGEKLRYLRLQQGMTQTELARQLALVRQSYISNLEAGRREPSLDLALGVAELFEVTTEYLLQDSIPVEAVTQHSIHWFVPQAHKARLFGEKLRHLRTQADLTQMDLANQLSLSAHTHISFMETGRKTPSIDLVLRIAKRFDVATDYLLWDTIPVEVKSNRSASETE